MGLGATQRSDVGVAGEVVAKFNLICIFRAELQKLTVQQNEKKLSEDRTVNANGCNMCSNTTWIFLGTNFCVGFVCFIFNCDENTDNEVSLIKPKHSFPVKTDT